MKTPRRWKNCRAANGKRGKGRNWRVLIFNYCQLSYLHDSQSLKDCKEDRKMSFFTCFLLQI